jgi:hypothetical protein
MQSVIPSAGAVIPVVESALYLSTCFDCGDESVYRPAKAFGTMPETWLDCNSPTTSPTPAAANAISASSGCG